MKYACVRLVLGDQLNIQHSWYEQVSDDILYVIAEHHQEATYVNHHVQKICAFFSAMSLFAKTLKDKGHHVLHLTLDDTQAFSTFSELLTHHIKEVQASRFEFQRPDEYRLLTQLLALKFPNCVSKMVESEHFLLPFDDIAQQFPEGKHVLMEHFYRRMRKRFDILMEEEKPLGGQWNFDKENRKKLTVKDVALVPEPLMFATDVQDIVLRLERHKVATLGSLQGELLWPVSREQSLQLLVYFCQCCLPNFGRFQDAMTEKTQHSWSLYHSRLSFSLNSKLLSPLEVINASVDAFLRSEGEIDIAQVEGFVRQILGWREYIRGVYWGNMPSYAKKNALSANNTLPDHFWTGKTQMSCLRSSISQSLDYAYAHHIQRLMVTGNFCLITEIDPDQVDQWYLGIYVDAIEWVEMPNTRGMALFADGGVVATKPYAASGAYINKMSDHCKGCHYDVKNKVGERACPLNSLYWRFMNKHREKLSKNPRTRMIFSAWERMGDELKQQTLQQAEIYLNQLEDL
ncbi:deoxyribodipyrimidine photolyase [Vibrio breoganii]|uniref:cryptochrome/photolyase family protein n=1 Tax=Vibrio breoganii TaxID=553239 RepID=UPI000C840781|nr:cryptochrome/photolyase family protein [Vibrio breoganii]PMG79480.1 deoxyribodipyrimidine photolyase [Vibrio breoganii]